MSFSRTCTNITLEGTVLKAMCRDKSHKLHSSSIDLNYYVGNNNGELVWQLGGNFADTSRYIHVDGGNFLKRGAYYLVWWAGVLSPYMLKAECKTTSGSWKDGYKELNLDDKISNMNGHLIHRDGPLKPQTVDFDLDSQDRPRKLQKLVVEREYKNGSSADQNHTLTTKYTETHAHRFEHSSGLKFSAGLGFRAKIPFLEGGSVNLGLEKDYRWTEGQVVTKSQELEYNFPLTVPAHKTIKAKILIDEEEIEVPYEMTILFDGCGKTVKSSGKFIGVQRVRVHTDVTEVKNDG